MATQHSISIEKNGVVLTDEDSYFFMEGDNLYDSIERVLKGSEQSLASYTHVSVDGETVKVSDLRAMTLQEDITVELLNKSKGGLIN